LVERLVELGVHRLAGIGPFDQYGQVVALPAKRIDQIAILLEALPALQNFLCFSRIVPEIGGGGARFEAVQFVAGVCGFKDSSAGRRRVS
jgi:hypothetical protein